MTDGRNGEMGEVGGAVDDAVQNLFGSVDVGTVFSEPIERGDDLIVLAAAWERAGGFGFGLFSSTLDLLG